MAEVVAAPVTTADTRELTRAAALTAVTAVVATTATDPESPTFKCDQCDTYESTSHSALLAHIAQAHTGNQQNRVRKLFECDVCNMKFSNGANMRRHRMRHTGVKPYECRVCQKRFFRKDHLAEHFTTHTKTLPYHCPICNRGFQRQIAMRAHFQNEHVGGANDQKSCPLCSYRAGSMKCLRVHFFNRHGIDLDNPAGAAAAAEQGLLQGGYSDSGGESARSGDNATPPMHFLTPHVEISMASEGGFEAQQVENSSQEVNTSVPPQQNGSPPSPPSSSSPSPQIPTSSETSITPSISLIPIKQEAPDETNNNYEKQRPLNLTNTIKVSPLKSLLREDLKRKMASRGTNIITRGADWGGKQAMVGNWTGVLSCNFCGIGFPDQTLYFLHKGCHADTNPWKCNICSEQCSNVYEFNSHLLSKSHQ